MMKELELRQSENLAVNYQPNGKCLEFIKIVGSNKNFINLFSAANGVGKTAVGVNIVANICYGIQNNWFKDLPLFEKFPYIKQGRIISDPTTIKEKIVSELKKWLPSNRFKIHYSTTKEGKQFESKWITDTGFEFNLMTTEQDTKEFESVDLGWVWIDEPCPESIFLATVARMRRGGIIFFTMTPLKYSAWIKDDLIDKAKEKQVDYITADVEDNCIEHGIRGILEHSAIERMSAQYPEDEKEARIHGKFGHLIGRVHKIFDRKLHVINPFKITYDDFCVYEALDPHPRVNDAIMWLAVDRNNQKYVIADLFEKGTTVELANRIKAMSSGWRVVKRIIDPSAFVVDKHSTDKCLAVQLKDLGLRYFFGAKDVVGGIRRTNDALIYTYQDDQMIRAPELLFFSNCERTIWEMENYVWQEWEGKTRDRKEINQKPKDKDDHQMENLHRLLLLEPTFIDYLSKIPNDSDFDPYSVI